MSQIRLNALELSQSRSVVEINAPSKRISDFFGVNVFDIVKMKHYLANDAYKKLVRCVETGEKIDADVADAVASAMKSWAIEKGATHFTHWFQPLRGTSAEKHDAFFDPNDGRPMERFKGSELVQQEPDASSFPSGGLRNTFEARGYTAWDPTSPAFLMETFGGVTLCIPSVFVSYTGHALDYKTPLLKSVDLVTKAATAVCQYFDKEVSKVTVTLGIEQEYFVIDRALYLARPDLMSAGRCVIGHSPARGQQLSDHYFGSIPDRIKNFMRDFEIESHKLGIPLRTRHNEVAPSQFECAPEFEEVNLAIDHNLLLMDLMSRIAHKHNLEVLFHEKPFAGVNGSGKHNNWSMSTNTGKNLLAPSSKGKENLQFLVFFVNVIKAVHENADLLRASIASASNDYRLGAHEAPPAIMSVFCGKDLTKVLDEIEQNGDVPITKGDNMYMKLGLDKIPSILLDNTDRNRTSPFAFTGNKFEFRAVGSSANCAAPMFVLNTIVADQLNKFTAEVDAMIEAGEKKELAIIKVLRRYITESKAIRFEGNNYSDEWVEEAAKRGLSNIHDTPRALQAYTSEKTIRLFEDNAILTKEELVARQEIMYEMYAMSVQIESRLLGDLAQNNILPIAVKYQNSILQNVKMLKEMGLLEENDTRLETITKISQHINAITGHFKEMVKARKQANGLDNALEVAIAYGEEVKPLFEKIRRAADKLELLVDDELWNLPKYRELLFMR